MHEYKLNKDFYVLFARVCLTTLAITLAFYGGLVVYLGQKALEFRQDVIDNLQNANDAVQSLSDLTEPHFQQAKWAIPSQQESNARHILHELVYEIYQEFPPPPGNYT